MVTTENRTWDRHGCSADSKHDLRSYVRISHRGNIVKQKGASDTEVTSKGQCPPQSLLPTAGPQAAPTSPASSLQSLRSPLGTPTPSSSSAQCHLPESHQSLRPHHICPHPVGGTRGWEPVGGLLPPGGLGLQVQSGLPRAGYQQLDPGGAVLPQGLAKWKGSHVTWTLLARLRRRSRCCEPGWGNRERLEGQQDPLQEP